MEASSTTATPAPAAAAAAPTPAAAAPAAAAAAAPAVPVEGQPPADGQQVAAGQVPPAGFPGALQQPAKVSASLYVGDLHPDVTESALFEIFKMCGPVASIRVCRDAVTRRSLGYAYVNFHNVEDAESALNNKNHTDIKGRPCRLMWSQRDPSLRKSGSGNVFIKNLPNDIDNKVLCDTFSEFGNILSCKVVVDENGKSKGYGFVHFDSKETADLAVKNLNGMLFNGKLAYVGPFIPRKERNHGNSERKFTNVFVKNLPETCTSEQFREMFGAFGPIQSAILMTDEFSKSKCFGFINFENADDAAKAVQEMNGKTSDDKELYCARAQKKAEREAELREKFEQIKLERLNKWQGVNLYVKNLDDTLDEEKLKAEFNTYGTITSVKVMRDEKDNSKGFGFVCFSKPEEAAKAVTEMNGRMIGTKPIYVALAQRKEMRRQMLEAQHAQRAQGMRIGMPQVAVPQSVGLPGANPALYPPGAPMFYQNVPQQRQGFMYPQQLVRTRWGTPQAQQQGRSSYQPVPNYVQSGQQRQQRQNRQRNMQGQGGPGQQQSGRGQPMQAGNSRGRFKYTPTARNNNNQGQGPRADQPEGIPLGGPMGGPAPVGDGPASLELNATRLAQANHEERKQIVGESLFSRITASHPAQAGKITGMFLDSMDMDELLQLLENEAALKEKISEALTVLEQHATTQSAPEQAAAPAEEATTADA